MMREPVLKALRQEQGSALGLWVLASALLAPELVPENWVLSLLQARALSQMWD
ncbi:MAG: hypothetical protein KA207_03875 [Burkholderiaceae bacterium]|nr:hypothetical protein [Burkholderiaceae bacterium]